MAATLACLLKTKQREEEAIWGGGGKGWGGGSGAFKNRQLRENRLKLTASFWHLTEIVKQLKKQTEASQRADYSLSASCCITQFPWQPWRPCVCVRVCVWRNWLDSHHLQSLNNHTSARTQTHTHTDEIRCPLDCEACPRCLCCCSQW